MQNEQNNIANELKSLIENVEFRKMAAKVAQALGVTADQWNKDKVFYLTMIAGQYLNWK